MISPAPSSRSIRDLDCSARMFLVTVCLEEDDLRHLGFGECEEARGVSWSTRARSILHRLVVRPELGRRVTDLLDLRHLETVIHVRALTPDQLAEESARHATSSTGEVLAGWVWALLTDTRPEACEPTRRLMGECYVRAMRALADCQPGEPRGSQAPRGHLHG